MQWKVRRLRDKADAALRRGRTDKAIELYDDLIKADSREPRWPHKKGDLLRKLNRQQDAIEAYAVAVDRYTSAGFEPRAIAMAKVILTIDPSRTDILEKVAPEEARRVREARARTLLSGQGGTDENPSGSFPTGSFSTGSFPTGSFTTGSFAKSPTGSWPRNSAAQMSNPPTGSFAVRPEDDDAHQGTPNLPRTTGAHATPPAVRGTGTHATPPAVRGTGTHATPPAVRGTGTHATPPAVRGTGTHVTPEPPRTGGVAQTPEPVRGGASAMGADPAEGVQAADTLTGHAAPPPPAPPAPIPPPVAAQPSPPAVHEDDEDDEDYDELVMEYVESIPGMEPPTPEMLRTFPAFAQVSEAALSAMIDRSNAIDAAEGELLIHAGDPANDIYILIAGSAKVYSNDGSSTEIAILERGDVFGEGCLVEAGERRTADVQAVDFLRAIRVTKSAIDDLILEHQDLGDALFDLHRSHVLDNVFRNTEIFRVLSASTRAKLSTLFEVRRLKAGSILIKDGKRGDGLYILMAGELALTDDVGEHLTVGVGTVVGVRSLFGKEPSRFTVKATTDALFLRLASTSFRMVVTEQPADVSALRQYASQRPEALPPALQT